MERLDAGIPLINKAEDRKIGKGYIKNAPQESTVYDKVL